MKRQILSITPLLVGAVIIAYGVSGPYVWPFYQEIIESILPDRLLDPLNPFFNGPRKDKYDGFKLGIYFIYYPSYVLLHLGLVSVLFRKSTRSRFVGIIAILGGLPLIALLTLLFYVLGLIALYEASMGLFKTFVGMPFILFIVEGGRLIDMDIERLLEQKKES